MTGFARNVRMKDFSRKGAKAQSRYRISNGFLCAFAPLREEKFFLPLSRRSKLSTFRQSH
jgi:hypothetical protein